MSASDYIEEIMWEAHKKGIASQFFNTVKELLTNNPPNTADDDLYRKAFELIIKKEYGNKEE